MPRIKKATDASGNVFYPATISKAIWDIDNNQRLSTTIAGKQDLIDSSNKLSADLITDGTTNKVINVKPDWNAASGDAAEILNKPTIPSYNTFGASGTNHSSGLVPDPGATEGSTKYLREDGTWAVPESDGGIMPVAYCTTDGATAAKVATCTGYSRRSNYSYVYLVLTEDNTAESQLTLNINDTGEMPIYINGGLSNVLNCTLYAGTYIVYLDANYCYINTNGYLTIRGIRKTSNGSSNAFWSTDGGYKTIPVMTSVTVSSGTTLSALKNTLHRFTSNVGTLAITLPSVTSGEVASIIICFYTTSSPNITLSSSSTIYKQSGFSIKASKRYEINAMSNGGHWLVTLVEY